MFSFSPACSSRQMSFVLLAEIIPPNAVYMLSVLNTSDAAPPRQGAATPPVTSPGGPHAKVQPANRKNGWMLRPLRASYE